MPDLPDEGRHLFEIRNATARFHILTLTPPITDDDVTQFTMEVRALDRDTAEPLLLLTDLRGNAEWPAAAGEQLSQMMRLNARGVKAHVIVAEPGSAVEAEVREIYDDDDDDAREVVTHLDDARRALVDHFGPAEDFAFETYYMDRR